ncbi:hypothetical protein HPP92_018720 [Vanilla planifolia]|uniref:LOB domain-containing protein n=1 Tax=Vanilla planifolia TaxID=51239 RepID=A0A835UNM3_VANPL|nr:hypothetical protein HPP92_018720 [Vanilla planifolia]
MSSSNSPCAACKFLRRKCTQGCVFSPYFPSDQPTKFANVHRVFGASNVAKLLNELPPSQREDAVNSLAYEAEARIHDPVYGCVGYISVLQHRLLQLQRELCAAKKELSAYAGAALAPQHQFQPVMSAVMGMGLGLGNPQPGQGIMIEAQQLTEPAVVARGQGMVRGIEQQEMNSANTGIGFGHMGGASEVVGVAAVATLPPPALALPHMGGFDGSFLVQGGQLNEVLFQGNYGHSMQRSHHQRRGSDDGRCGAGPSSS